MNLSSLDLNLLIALDALLREASVTRAALRVGLGQPALSMSLRRLRSHFGDELLVRVGKRYELTPLAIRLREPTNVAVASIDRVFAAGRMFDAATTERQFHVLCSDYTMAVIGPVVCDLFAQRAPKARLRLSQLGVQPTEYTMGNESSMPTSQTLTRFDAVVAPSGTFSSAPHMALWTDRWTWLVSRGNTVVGETVDAGDMNTLPWVVFHDDTVLAQLGCRPSDPHIDAVVGSYLALPFYIADSPRIGPLPELLAEHFSDHTALRVVPTQENSEFVEALWWHSMFDDDAGHVWLRGVFDEARHMIGLRTLSMI